MCSPGPFGHAPLMMGREMTRFPHKPKRLLLGHPGKPLRRIWLKWEQTLLGADHDVASLLVILDARDDMNRLGGRFGSGTQAGSRACGLGSLLDRAAWLRRSQWHNGIWPGLLHQAGQISHLVLQN